MNMENIIELITTNGIAVGIIIYFLYKDYKFNGTIIALLTEITKVLEALKVMNKIEE